MVFYSDYQSMSQSEGEELSSKNKDLDIRESKCTADRKPIKNLKLVKQV